MFFISYDEGGEKANCFICKTILLRGISQGIYTSKNKSTSFFSPKTYIFAKRFANGKAKHIQTVVSKVCDLTPWKDVAQEEIERRTSRSSNNNVSSCNTFLLKEKCPTSS